MKPFLIIGIILLCILLVSCAQKSLSQVQEIKTELMPPNAQTIKEQPTEVINQTKIIQPISDAHPLKEFNVEVFQFGYSPSEIHVNQGDKVRINLATRDVAHSFTLPDFDFSISARFNHPSTGEFIADKKGIYNWFCNIPCGEGHRDMRGMLVVE